jgi:hypothetical protein
MTVTEPKKIDIVGLDSATGDAVLTIVDHLDWDDVEAHLHALQEKINSYLAFIEAGELLETYPKALGKNVILEVLISHPLSTEAVGFYAKAGALVSAAGFELRHSLVK